MQLSLLESVLGWLTNPAATYLNTGRAPTRMGNAHPSVVPYRVFWARDRPLVLACGNDSQFRNVCHVLGSPEWADDPRFVTNRERVRNRAALIPLLAAFRERDADDRVDTPLAAGVPAGPINTLDRVFSDPRVLARGLPAAVPHPTPGSVRLAGIRMTLLATPPSIERHPPLLGEVLGMLPAEIAALRADGAIQPDRRVCELLHRLPAGAAFGVDAPRR